MFIHIEDERNREEKEIGRRTCDITEESNNPPGPCPLADLSPFGRVDAIELEGTATRLAPFALVPAAIFEAFTLADMFLVAIKLSSSLPPPVLSSFDSKRCSTCFVDLCASFLSFIKKEPQCS